MTLRLIKRFNSLKHRPLAFFKKSFPPKAAVKPSTITFRHEKHRDPFGWMRFGEDPAVLDYLKKENAYADRCMQGSEPLRKQLVAEMMARFSANKVGVPLERGNYFYWTVEASRDSYPVYWAKRRGAGAREFLLDLNTLAENCLELEMGDLELSPEGDYLAYTYDRKGELHYALVVVDRMQNKTQKRARVTRDFVWSPCGKALYYIELDDLGRASRLKRHLVDTALESDELLYEEEDPTLILQLERASDGRYLFLTSLGQSTTEVRYYCLNQIGDGGKLAIPKRQGVRYFLQTAGQEHFYLLTNENAPDYQIVIAPIFDLTQKGRVVIVPHQEGGFIQEWRVFQEHIVLLRRQEGLPAVQIWDHRGRFFRQLDFAEQACQISLHRHCGGSKGSLLFHYASPLTPRTLYEYHLYAGQLKVLQVEEVPTFHQEDYRLKRVFATAGDGTRIPITLFYRKERSNGVLSPLLLQAYGAYGDCFDLGFSKEILSLVDRGVIYAVAHVRGGGELGWNWYQQGRLLSKKNSIYDLIDSMQYLIDRRYTSPRQLALWGRSAGGLLVGAAINRVPELIRAAIADVPFVDVIGDMFQAEHPWTPYEYEEWGDPQMPGYYEYMQTYSPYENMRGGKLPALLATGALWDTLVPFTEPLKWVARLRSQKKNRTPLLLKIDTQAGHNGKALLQRRLEESAFKYAFLLKQIT